MYWLFHNLINFYVYLYLHYFVYVRRFNVHQCVLNASNQIRYLLILFLFIVAKCLITTLINNAFITFIPLLFIHSYTALNWLLKSLKYSFLRERINLRSIYETRRSWRIEESFMEASILKIRIWLWIQV